MSCDQSATGHCDPVRGIAKAKDLSDAMPNPVFLAAGHCQARGRQMPACTLPEDHLARAIRRLPRRAGVGLNSRALRINHVSLASSEAHPNAKPLAGVDASGLPR